MSGANSAARKRACRRRGIVFCCFNNSYKFTPEIFDVWMRLLQAVDGSVLWLSEPNDSARRNLIARSGEPGHQRGPAGVRAVRFRTSTTISRGSLWPTCSSTRCPTTRTPPRAMRCGQGVPVITTPGPTFAGRVAASLLCAVGLPELIAPSLSAYEARALELASDPQALHAVKAKLKATRATFPLFDTARFTRHLELAFIAMCERKRRGLPPERFSVATAP